MHKSKKLTIILFCVIVFAGGWAIFLSHEYVAPILMYHSVTPDAQPQNRLAVSVKAFEHQMHFLRAHHYTILPLSTLARLISENKKLPPRTITVTFDDGYKDNYTYAFPVLRKYNIPATIFLIVNEIERPEGDRLSWLNIRIMQASGLITFGSHTLTHPYLTEITSEAILKKEIFDSKKILEERLGRKVDIFCYPNGSFNKKIRQLVIDAGYTLAMVTNPGKEYADNDLFLLKRLRISENSSNMFIFAVETSGYYTFVKEYKKEHKLR